MMNPIELYLFLGFHLVNTPNQRVSTDKLRGVHYVSFRSARRPQGEFNVTFGLGNFELQTEGYGSNMSRKGWVGLSVDHPRATSLATGLGSRGFGVKDTRVRGINTSGCPRNVSRTNLKIGFFMIVLIFFERFYDPHL